MIGSHRCPCCNVEMLFLNFPSSSERFCCLLDASYRSRRPQRAPNKAPQTSTTTNCRRGTRPGGPVPASAAMMLSFLRTPFASRPPFSPIETKLVDMVDTSNPRPDGALKKMTGRGCPTPFPSLFLSLFTVPPWYQDPWLLCSVVPPSSRDHP